MQTVNKSINFQSDRGNDIYKQNEVIRIKLDPGSAPLVNTQDSYLMFSLQIDSDNPLYCIPEPDLGAVPFEQITLMDGNEMTMLEQMDNVGLWTCMKNYYGNNINDEHLQHIYEGRCPPHNSLYIDVASQEFPTTANVANTYDKRQNSKGGGFGSQYHQITTTEAGAVSRKAQILYRFPMSGLLSAMKSELLPLVTLNGLVIKITLMENAKFLRVQEVKHSVVGEIGETIDVGFGDLDTTAVPHTQAHFAPTAGVNLKTEYGWFGYIGSDGVPVDGDLIDTGLGTTVGMLGVVLQKKTDAGGCLGLDDCRNCSLKVGGYLSAAYKTGAGDWATQLNGLTAVNVVTANEKIKSVKMDTNGRIVVMFTGPVTPLNGGGNAGVLIESGAPVCAWTLDTPAGETSLNESGYAVSDLQMVCNVVEAPAGYMEAMVNQASSGQLKIQYNSYRDERVNITTGSISNEIFIPCDLQRCYCILAVNEILRGHNLFQNDFKPTKTNLFNYQWIMNGTNVPNIPVSLSRLAADKVSPLQIIELEKALDESSIRIRNIQNPHNFPVIGRRLGAYGDSVSLLDKTTKCRINFSPTQDQNLLYHFYIYHTKTIMFEGGSRVVLE